MSRSGAILIATLAPCFDGVQLPLSTSTPPRPYSWLAGARAQHAASLQVEEAGGLAAATAGCVEQLGGGAAPGGSGAFVTSWSTGTFYGFDQNSYDSMTNDMGR
jgi:hypothetical protein